MVCWPVLSICQIGRIEEGAQSPRLSVPLILCEMQQLLSNGLVYIGQYELIAITAFTDW
jgi:hypothetical protein